MAHPSDLHRFATGYPGTFSPSELDLLVGTCHPPDAGADELIEWLEDDDSSARCVPDWSGEAYKNAA